MITGDAAVKSRLTVPAFIVGVRGTSVSETANCRLMNGGVNPMSVELLSVTVIDTTPAPGAEKSVGCAPEPITV